VIEIAQYDGSDGVDTDAQTSTAVQLIALICLSCIASDGRTGRGYTPCLKKLRVLFFNNSLKNYDFWISQGSVATVLK